MLSDIEKLVKYEEALKELHALKKQLDGEASYDNIEISLSSSMIIREKWSNNEGHLSKTYEFNFSAIDDIRDRMRKKIIYRKDKLTKLEKS